MNDTILKTYKNQRYHTVKIDTPNEFGQKTSHSYNREDADNGVQIICGVNCTDGVRISKKDSYRKYKDIVKDDIVVYRNFQCKVVGKSQSIFTSGNGVSYLRLAFSLITDMSDKPKIRYTAYSSDVIKIYYDYNDPYDRAMIDEQLEESIS